MSADPMGTRLLRHWHPLIRGCARADTVELYPFRDEALHRCPKIISGENMLDRDIYRFAAGFGLTAAETRVLGEIIAGDGLLAAAARLNINEATARTHARRIFDKTGTQRQTELICRFFVYARATLTGPEQPKITADCAWRHRFR